MAQSQPHRINTLWFITLGVTALAAGILVYILLLESALGAFSIEEAAPGFRQEASPRVAILRSDYTRQVHRQLNGEEAGDGWVDGTIQSWRDFLLARTRGRNRRFLFDEINDDTLEAGRLDRFDVLILPSVRAMSDREIEVIKAFMDRGGSVLATWTPGVYDEKGNWRGWSFVEEAFGVKFEGFVERGMGNYRVYPDTFPGFTPEGVYVPERVLQDQADAYTRPGMRDLADDYDFNPLSGYVRIDSLQGQQPRHDYATARPVRARLRDLDGQLRMQDAVAVTYYTWTGGDPAQQVPYPSTSGGIRRFTLRGNTPLTANMPSGYRPKVQVYNSGVRVRVMEDRTQPAGFWHDFAIEEGPAAEAVDNTVGIVYGTYGRNKGRFVYMGFQRDAMGVDPCDPSNPDLVCDREDWRRLGEFFANVVDYLRRRPIIWAHDWPYDDQGGSAINPHPAAAILVGIGENEVGNFANVQGILRQANMPGTYMVRPERVGGQRALLQRLHADGDVGVLDDLRRNGDAPERDQEERLTALKAQLESYVGAPVHGYRATTPGMFGALRNNTIESYTMGGLADAGYTYFLPDSIGRRTSPKIMGNPFETLTRIGRTAKPDPALMGETGATPGASYFIEDIERAAYEGGLYNLVYSSDGLGRPENSETLEAIVAELRRRNFWVVDGDSLASWWRLRGGIGVDVQGRGHSRILVSVSNNNGHIAERAAVSITLPFRVDDVDIRPELIDIEFGFPQIIRPHADVPRYKLIQDNTVLVIAIDDLKPQQYRIYNIDLLGCGPDGECTPLMADD